jgi:hypothetical protein
VREVGSDKIILKNTFAELEYAFKRIYVGDEELVPDYINRYR